jgi:hypothetical protein
MLRQRRIINPLDDLWTHRVNELPSSSNLLSLLSAPVSFLRLLALGVRHSSDVASFEGWRAFPRVTLVLQWDQPMSIILRRSWGK